MVQKGHLEGTDFQQYWEKTKKHTGTTKGPIHLFAKLMNDIGIKIDATHKWKVNDKWTRISRTLRSLSEDKQMTECGNS